jgi:hypothetical protein
VEDASHGPVPFPGADPRAGPPAVDSETPRARKSGRERAEVRGRGAS